LRLACEIYNALRRADIDFHRENGRGLTLRELRQLALDLRKRNEGYQQLYSQLARAHEHLANLRRDIYMKLGRYLAEHYDVVVMEDIDLKRLIGKSNRALRRSLQDAALGMMRSIIKYQVEKYGKAFILVDPRDSSRTCARCGFVRADLTLGDRAFECPACGRRVDRDYNASLNILRRAGWEPPVAPVELRPLPAALGRGQGGAVKQEAPPEGRGSSLKVEDAPRGYRRWTSWRSSGGRWALGAC